MKATQERARRETDFAFFRVASWKSPRVSSARENAAFDDAAFLNLREF